jgi:CubicO group peptidase (beta-lactamase class C family)
MIRKSVLIKAAVFLTGLFIFSAPLSLLADERTDRVDKLFAKWDNKESPGCALGIIQDGKFIYRRGYGMANLEYNLPISSQSVFRIGSTSKQFTAMCITLLEEEGKLSLDDDIRLHLPEMPDYLTPVTIRHLIHHTSGVRDYLTLAELAGEREDDYVVDGEVMALIARQKELNFPPGKEFLYSNSGYFLLSEIVKRITGNSMRDYAEEKIFKSLGMTHTHFHNDHREIVKNRASGYMPAGKGGFRISMTTLDMIGDGGVFTTVDDLLLWDRNFYDNRLGKGDPSLITRMQEKGRLNSGRELSYARGLDVEKYRGLPLISHGGSFVGFRAEMIRFPEQRFSVIVLANLGSIDPSGLALRVADILLEDILAEKKSPAPKNESPAFVALAEEKLRRLAGTFVDKEKEHVVRINQTAKGITAVWAGNAIASLPVDENQFISQAPPHRFSLQFSEKDGSLHLELAGARPVSEKFIRIPEYKPSKEELAFYSGQYYSPELDVTYSLVLKEGKLCLQHQNPFMNSPKMGMEPVDQAWFTLDWWNIRFEIKEGKVSAFTISAGRVKNIRFNRVGEDGLKKENSVGIS